MEITASHPHSNLTFISPDKHNKDFSNNNLKLPIKIQLPIHKPNYNQPKPIKLIPKPNKSYLKPITTTSDILHLMDTLKLPIPLDIYTSLIKECTKLCHPLKSIELHAHMKRNGVRLSLTILNRLLLMYVSSGCIEHARQLFDEMPVRSFNSWAVVIAGCVENGEFDEAIDIFMDFLYEAELKNVDRRHLELPVTGILVCVLRCCLCTMNLELGRQLHGWLWKMGYSRNVVLSSFLINFYGKLKCSEDAQTVFEQVGFRNTAVWTSLIVNCCSDENFKEAVSVFKEMGSENVRMNGYTFSSVLKACSRVGDIGCGQQVHANVMKLGLGSNEFVQCALVDLYGRCGLLKDATRMFETGENKRNVACYNAILTNYAQHGLCREAMQILYKMKLDGFKPNDSSFSEVNLACGCIIQENEMDVGS